MAAGWSTVVIGIGCAVLGYVARDWQYERAARAEAERQLVVALEKPAATVDAERRLNTATENRERGKATARAAVASAPRLTDCPIPYELASMLTTQAQSTRSTAGAGVSRGPVP